MNVLVDSRTHSGYLNQSWLCLKHLHLFDLVPQYFLIFLGRQFSRVTHEFVNSCLILWLSVYIYQITQSLVQHKYILDWHATKNITIFFTAIVFVHMSVQAFLTAPVLFFNAAAYHCLCKSAHYLSAASIEFMCLDM